ncbi:ATP-binding protein [Eikenella sp. S3360]|uniref:ATP-binding protein n=1 Tax=Eikenella glucosivorans TaxID=2766967 RepID=A0ABS0N7M0_9NEIS|nr:ATP-binding protein [Eikenella glucosivorans]MBH5328301.1 ATP-binding protein [Eikenella glucosivorans]
MQLILFIGAQASGKSTFYKQHFADSYIRLNLDMLKTRHREQLLFDACLQAKQNLVIDNTNPTVEDRARYIVPAQAARFQIIAYYFDSDLNAAIARNAKRTGKANIPEVGVRATFKKLQAPHYAEGFAEIYRVQINPNGGFNCQLIPKENHEI